MVERMPALTEYLPAVKRYLLEYPKVSLPKTESFLYLAKGQVRVKADDSDHPSDDCRRADSCRCRLEDALCEPLLLDRHRIARDGPRRRAGRGFLVRQREPEPI